MLTMTLSCGHIGYFLACLIFLSTFKFHHACLFKNLHCFKSHLLKNFSKLTYSGVLVWSLSCWIFSKTCCGDSFSDKRISIFWNKSLQKKKTLTENYFLKYIKRLSQTGHICTVTKYAVMKEKFLLPLLLKQFINNPKKPRKNSIRNFILLTKRFFVHKV